MKKYHSLIRAAALIAVFLTQFALGSSAIAQTTVSLSITDSVMAETWPGQSPNAGNICVTRTGSTASPLTVWVKLSGTAVRGVDYQFGVAVGTYVTISAGSSQLNIPINPMDDLISEVTETIRFELDDNTASGTAVPYSLGTDRVIVNLLDNESLPPRVVVDVEALNDANEETSTPGAFRITRSGNTSVAVTVAYSIESSATAGDDYAPLSGSVLIPAGNEFADVIITPVDDTELEGSELVTLTILPSTCPGTFPPTADCYSFGANTSADVTIYDNEIPPVRAVVSVAALNGASENGAVAGAFRFARSANMDVALTVAYTLGGTATEGFDFAALSGSVVIPAGVEFVDITVAPVDDALLESAESVTLSIVPSDCPGLFPAAECYLVGASASALLTILDNEIPPAVTLSAVQNTNVAGSPAAGLGTFTGSATNGHIVSYQIRVDGVLKISGNTDYTNPPAPGTPFQHDFAITNLIAGNHTIQATVNDNQGFTATATTTLFVSIIAPPPLSLEIIALDNDAAETLPGETPNTSKFLYRQSGNAGELELFFLSFAGSAREGIDYNVITGPWINTTNGITNIWSQEFTIVPTDDYIMEGTETVTLQMCFINLICIYGVCAPGGTSCGGGATINLHDNDTNPPPYAVVSVTTSDADAQEVSTLPGVTRNTGTFNITRTSPPTNDLPVFYSLSGTALNGVDYSPLSGVAIIPTGSNSTTVEVNPLLDVQLESNESVILTLRPTTNAPLYLLDPGVNNSATVTIRDYAATNIPVVRIKAIDGQAYEQPSVSPHAVFQVERLGSIASAITVPYTVTGTATNGVDYVALPGFVTLAANVRTANITIIPYLDNELNEPDESVIITLQPTSSGVTPPLYLLIGGTDTAGATIREDAPIVVNPPLNRYQRALRYRYPGRYRTVIVPLPTLPAVPPPAGSSAVAVTWAVEASTNLATWAEIGQTEDPEEFVDPDAGDAPQRFYRFRQVTPATP